jgi:hypothetical protein
VLAKILPLRPSLILCPALEVSALGVSELGVIVYLTRELGDIKRAEIARSHEVIKSNLTRD